MKKLFNDMSPNVDKKYCLLRDDPRYEKQKDFVESLWVNYSKYADGDFAIKITEDFNARFWEMYLSSSLLGMNLELVPKGPAEGPDIQIVLENNKTLWIEASISNAGEGTDSVQDIVCDEFVQTPIDSYFLRFCNTLNTKNKKLNVYLDKKIVSPKDFFVVAINGFPVTHFSEDDEIPYIVQALYGIGPYFVTIDITSKLPINEGFSRKEDITKKSGCDVSSNTFNNGSYTNISGVIYSNADLFNLPTPHILGSDFIFVHNRTSMKPINRGWLPIGLEYWIENNKLRTYLFNTNNSSI